MRITFVDGPLKGREEDVPDDRLEQDRPFFWPPDPDRSDDDPLTPGVDGVLEYLYQGDGTATYVGGRLAGE